MAASAEYAQEETEEILRETGILSEDDLSSAHKRQSLSGHCLGEPAYARQAYRTQGREMRNCERLTFL